MGYAIGTFESIRNYYARGVVSTGKAVAELGAQQLYGKADDTDRLVKFITYFNPDFTADAEKVSELTKLCDMGLVATAFRHAGFEYESFDVNDNLATTQFDLNTDEVPRQHLNKYDLVTNFGTTEHVFNQVNAFKVIHDLTKKNGIMWHNVPISGMFDHCLVTYNPKMFHELAGNNLYEIVDSFIGVETESKPLPESYHTIRGAEGVRATDAFMQVILRKTQASPFIPPIDHLEDDSDGRIFRYMVRNILRALHSEGGIGAHPELVEKFTEFLVARTGKG